MTNVVSTTSIRVGSELEIRHSMREMIRTAVLEGLGRRSLMVDVDADQMGLVGAAALANGIPLPDRQAMREFGQGFGLPWLVLRGLPAQEELPNTPQGYGDDTQMLFSDTMLLGAMQLAGLKPIAYSYENFSRVMRNVAPSKQEVDSVSSHGSKRDLHWHTDNAYAFEDGYRSPRSTGSFIEPVGSPSPRFLCFVGLRLNDGRGNAVPTELLPVDAILADMPKRLRNHLLRPIFEIRPGASNTRASMKRMPLLEVCPRTGAYLLRFNANEGQTLGLSTLATGAVTELSKMLEDMESRSIPIYLRPGEVLMFDNYRVLQRRKSFEPGAWDNARWLRRCFGTTDPSSGQFVDRMHRPYVWQ
jgi:L-asparagine oxygenase